MIGVAVVIKDTYSYSMGEVVVIQEHLPQWFYRENSGYYMDGYNAAEDFVFYENEILLLPIGTWLSDFLLKRME